jgi:hypothetical protein
MTPQDPSRGRPRSRSPAERGAEFAAHQARLKEEAAARRKSAEERTDAPSGRRPRTGVKTKSNA